MPQSIRRIVTGHDATGRSNITFEGDAPNIMEMDAWPGARITDLWATTEMPIDNDGLEDRGGVRCGLGRDSARRRRRVRRRREPSKGCAAHGGRDHDRTDDNGLSHHGTGGS